MNEKSRDAQENPNAKDDINNGQSISVRPFYLTLNLPWRFALVAGDCSAIAARTFAKTWAKRVKPRNP